MLGHFIGYGLNFCVLFTGDKVRGVFDGLKIQYFITGILIGITAFPIQFASMFDGVGVTCVGSKAFYQEIANTFARMQSLQESLQQERFLEIFSNIARDLYCSWI